MIDFEQKYRQIESENKRLKKAVGELSILNDLALAISGSLDSEKIVRAIISRSIRAIDAEQGDITMVVEDKENPTQTLVRSMVSTSIHSPLHLNQNLLGWMQINKKPLLINEPGNDERFRNVKWDKSVRSLHCAPLMAKSKLTGILTVYNKKGDGLFDESDQRLLSMLNRELNPDSREVIQAGKSTIPAAFEQYVQGLGHLQRFERLGNINSAIASFEEAVALDPRFALAYAGLGQAFENTGDHEQAEQTYRRAIELAEEHNRSIQMTRNC